MLVPVPGQALTFDFSFTNDPTFGTASGTVTGEIVGLSDNASSAATAVYIDSFPTAPFHLFGGIPLFSLQLPGPTPFNVLSPPAPDMVSIISNAFTVSNGQVDSAGFRANIIDPSRGFNYIVNALELTTTANATGNLYNRFVYNHTDINGVTPNLSVGSLSVSFSPAVPEPAGVPGPVAGAGLPGMLLVGSGFLAWWCRKRKYEARADTANWMIAA